jgi:hypothetical protein
MITRDKIVHRWGKLDREQYVIPIRSNVIIETTGALSAEYRNDQEVRRIIEKDMGDTILREIYGEMWMAWGSTHRAILEAVIHPIDAQKVDRLLEDFRKILFRPMDSRSVAIDNANISESDHNEDSKSSGKDQGA